ncbi:endonuclease NucS domain-containing protein [Blastococcus tunisiensis]|uniref:Endonuclease NucS C-terminal domain-containing protein n=1 Tax=Blastococcus tunisiensis TaxID=1798228 RepID=A0A1I2B8P8_9ACTN|nr:endonuclease NucS domain-containing protein [Blastococcus sp. DSM 46838]SFE52511.1 Protein of unknown function DUF91 [Blastococcus sp. DSM 46838]
MPLEVGLWRIDGGKPVKVPATGVPLESQLETMIEADPTILGTPLLLIGRQVPTDFGKFIDLLAIDDEGALHVLELKRDRTPREVVAQLLDYGSWVRSLSHEQVIDIFANYKPGVAFEQEWTDTFAADVPEELNDGHRLTVVAGDVDPATERIIAYLSDFSVPINVVFFRYFDDGERAYLARTWLMDEARTPARKAGAGRGGTKEAWNEQDWYVSFGEESGNRSWEDASRYGFVSAGGAEWFSRTLRKLPIGARVFACIPGTGYVGVGTVAGEARPFEDAVVDLEGELVKLADQPLAAAYQHPPRPNGEEHREYVVPVTWERTRPRSDAYWVKGMFANQNSACKLRNRFTLEQLATAFHLGE